MAMRAMMPWVRMSLRSHSPSATSRSGLLGMFPPSRNIEVSMALKWNNVREAKRKIGVNPSLDRKFQTRKDKQK